LAPRIITQSTGQISLVAVVSIDVFTNAEEYRRSSTHLVYFPIAIVIIASNSNDTKDKYDYSIVERFLSTAYSFTYYEWLEQSPNQLASSVMSLLLPSPLEY